MQSIYDSADEDGHRYLLLDEIIGHRKLKDALNKSKGYIVSSKDRKPSKDNQRLENTDPVERWTAFLDPNG